MRFERKHGHAKSKSGPPSRIYRIWVSMLGRCYLPKHIHYHRYGGRGITVCPEWRESFIAFLNDMGPTYQEGLSLDRKDNDLGYFPDNCRWATAKEQRRNSSFLRLIDTPKGPMLCLDAAHTFNIPRTTLMKRLKRGVDPFRTTKYPTHP
jgi:hypothetical protein